MYRRSFAAILAALLVAGQAIAEVEPAADAVSCMASGYDVFIQNDSDTVIAAGTEIDWHVPFTRTSGTHSLRRALDPGTRVALSGAMGSDFVGGDSPCEVLAAQEPEE